MITATGHRRDDFLPTVELYTKQLSEITSGAVIFRRGGDVNFPIAFVEDFDKITSSPVAKLAQLFYNSEEALIDAFSGDATCIFRLKSDASGIRLAALFIENSDNTEFLNSCLFSAGTRALGLFGGSDSNDSVFSYDRKFVEQQAFSPSDEILIRLISDPRIKAGMTREEAMSLIPEILGEQKQ